MNKDIEWQKQYCQAALPHGEVHLWLVSIAAMEAQLDDLCSLLSEEEINQAERFHFEKDQKRYVVARGMLRKILSQYCQFEPEAHQFGYNQYGKPYLTDNDWLRFNVSHSGDKILYGFTQNRELGVDIEYVKPFENAHQIVERFFSDHEKNQFRSVPDHMKNRAFLNCWTRKEAYIKALGKGMSLPLDEFSVYFMPDEPACLLETKHDIREKDRWTLQEIKVGEGYVAAVTVEGRNLDFKTQWGLNNIDYNRQRSFRRESFYER